MTSENGTPSPEKDKRTPEQIEADLARMRLELTDDVNELADRLDPRAQMGAAKTAATQRARTFADDLKRRDPKALGLTGGAAALFVLAVVRAVRRR
ncbi:MAG: DUF3618 domain-containing protein [Georgenia sp.]